MTKFDLVLHIQSTFLNRLQTLVKAVYVQARPRLGMLFHRTESWGSTVEDVINYDYDQCQKCQDSQKVIKWLYFACRESSHCTD